MADDPHLSTANKRAQGGGAKKTPDPILCGIIMPISETLNHSEAHWSDVQKLVHRAVRSAGFEPKNVWESASTDRISERIVGNIFNLPIVVVDISDLNANVMFELGLRLSSKKPTVVIANAGQQIPFDIRDFQTTFYPSDMNMLGMEDFFAKLSKTLQDRHATFLSDKYVPFLSNVIIDVASPETREVGLNELIISRLDEIARRVSSIESSNRLINIGGRSLKSSPNRGFSSIDYIIPQDTVNGFVDRIIDISEVISIAESDANDGKVQVSVTFSSPVPWNSNLRRKVSEIAISFGGDEEIPF